MALKRIRKELDYINSGGGAVEPKPDGELSDWLSAAPVTDDDLFEWDVTVLGPNGTPYEGGKYVFKVRFPTDYPFNPPKIHLSTKIYHCNWAANGTECLDITSSSGWSPALSVVRIMMCYRSMMSDPNAVLDDAARPEIARHYNQDKAAHDAIAKEWAQLYAGAPEGARKMLTIQHVKRSGDGLTISAASIGGVLMELEVGMAACWSEVVIGFKSAFDLDLVPSVLDCKGRVFDPDEQVLTTVAVRVPVNSDVLDACVAHLLERFRSGTEGTFHGESLSSTLRQYILQSDVAEGSEVRSAAVAECLAQLDSADAETAAESIRAVLEISVGSDVYA